MDKTVESEIKSAKIVISTEAPNSEARLSRMQKEIRSDLSPNFTEMKTSERSSRFGRPQRKRSIDGIIPTEVAKFVPKNSPKRVKPKLDAESKERNDDALDESKETHDTSMELTEPVKSEPMEHSPTLTIETTSEGLGGSETAETLSETFSASTTNSVRQLTFEEDRNDSDNDSAVGSLDNMVNDKPTKFEGFYPGQILWGSFARTTWFPCMVFPLDSEGNFAKDNSRKQIQVKYFNWNGATAMLSARNTFEFKDIKDFWDQIEKLNINKRKVKNFSKACHKAIEEAKFFSRYPPDQRVELFTKIVDHQRGLPLKSPVAVKTELRHSVDSAVESAGSPETAPSSPHHENKSEDPIECYLKTMAEYDALLSVQKATTKPKVKKIVNTPKAETPVDVDDKRRRSLRPVKKRKFSDFEELKNTSVSSVDVVVKKERRDSLEPKPKKAKIVREETLEERFLVNPDDLKQMFRNRSKKHRVCSSCLELTQEPTYRCNGVGSNKCSGWFHESCAESFEKIDELIRHTTGDSNDVIKKITKTNLRCSSCAKEIKNCFACNKPIENESELKSCSNSECRLTFHDTCMKQWPQMNKKTQLCPQHVCHTCYSRDIHNSGQLVKCLRCPASYHLQVSCLPAGSDILTQTQIICPRHQIGGITKSTPIMNIDWCNICLGSGTLVCCDSCPSAFHHDCIKYEQSDENFNCEDCRDGRLPMYNTIVWARVGNYRWWPGLTMPDHIVPESVLKTRKSQREFCVRFFGSYDYFWTTCERVFEYDGANMNAAKGKTSRLDSAFNQALKEANDMSKILLSRLEEPTKSKPKPYTKLMQNRPVPPIKLKKPNESLVGKCQCSPDDPNPCGLDSSCLNMQLHVECQKEVCPAGDKCQNQKLRNREEIEMKIIQTKTRGFGAAPVKDVPVDTFVVEYIGELIDSAEMKRRMNRKLEKKEKDFYFLTIGADLYVDAEPAGNNARFINHSCSPNCYTRKIVVDGNTRIGIFSNQMIKAGEELTFDYQMEFVGKEKSRCSCGSDKCSGYIGEKPKEAEKVKRPVAKKAIARKNLGSSSKSQKKKTKVQILSVETGTDPFSTMLEKMVEPLKNEAETKHEDIKTENHDGMKTENHDEE